MGAKYQAATLTFYIVNVAPVSHKHHGSRSRARIRKTQFTQISDAILSLEPINGLALA